MLINTILATSNPFFDAYSQSDLLGKMIFLGLYALSICTWVILIFKVWKTYQAKRYALRFQETFRMQRSHPLSLEYENVLSGNCNPFLDLYKVLKKQAQDLITKNRHFCSPELNQTTHLSLSDIDVIASHLSIQVLQQIRNLERHLYLLATSVSLAPFLGLLGTVWGILTTFSELQSQSANGTHQMVLSGLSMALATTVLGLIVAIPALIGYNYLKSSVRDFGTEMEGFSNEILAAVELQYRKVDI